MFNPQKATGEWQTLDARHHLHSFTDPKLIESEGSRIIVRAEGSTVWDNDGREILDCMAGLWCVNIGYGRRELSDAAAAQMALLPYYNNHFQSASPPMIELAARLAGLTPDTINHFAFANSGSEANDAIARLARQFWQLQGRVTKRTIISRTMAYHGSTVMGSALGGMPHMHAMDGGVSNEVVHIAHPHWYLYGEGLSRDEFGLKAARALEDKILELGAENVCAFIGEPVQGAGGVIDPPSTYWPEIQRICKQYDILLIADEVICGFGRTGSWFGSQTLGIQPDFMPMAKGLSSGYLPVAAVGIHDRVYNVLADGGHLAHGYTYSGHPVACAVALANIDIIENEGLVARVRDDIGPYFMAALDKLVASSPIVGERRGIGMMAALQLVKNKDTRELPTLTDNAGIFCRDYCYNEGLIVRAVGPSIVLSPPLIYTHAEVDQTVDILGRALDATAKKLGV
ncbi:aminotransferase [Asticcacaulis sp. ZE23SCel15]|uniref:aminotransferase n=1 Tax=Asticcacaulis sp. ZE23SCel15 TaxID=3059027 RepID=UPI00265F127E|nr:aminotransferase [Asticcacaulis sp. ZE23SCel15]WKL57336.1 aminotransferase [Asticcacaulis sp. ZE23SCel15]